MTSCWPRWPSGCCGPPSEGDVVARLGGDRFAVLLPDADDTSTGAALSRLVTALEQPVDVAGGISVSVRIGAALGPAADAGALLSAAEQAVQTAKDSPEAGGVHVVRGESPSVAVARARLVEDLRRGIDAGELVVHYQPVLALDGVTVVGAEALVRWQHPERGLLLPGDFIEAAEESGLVVALGERVLTDACRAAARWSGAGPFHVAVNLSAKQLVSPDVVDVVRRCLADAGARAENLMLEVTESAVMADVEAAGRTLTALRGLGVALAVDDFGTGYSSLTYLKTFPVSALKVDRSFVAGLGENADDEAIVSSTLSLARAMGLDCIAEGVETEEQRRVLQLLGCGSAQGWLWSPALPEAEFADWVAERRVLALDRGVGRPQRDATASVAGTAAISERIQQLQVAGSSLHTIAAALNTEGLLPEPGRRWSARTVARFYGAQRLSQGAAHLRTGSADRQV